MKIKAHEKLIQNFEKKKKNISQNYSKEPA